MISQTNLALDQRGKLALKSTVSTEESSSMVKALGESCRKNGGISMWELTSQTGLLRISTALASISLLDSVSNPIANTPF